MAIRTLSEHGVRMAIHFFVNFDVFWAPAVSQSKTCPINTKLGDFVNLGVLFLTTVCDTWINSCLSHNLKTRT